MVPTNFALRTTSSNPRVPLLRDAKARLNEGDLLVAKGDRVQDATNWDERKPSWREIETETTSLVLQPVESRRSAAGLENAKWALAPVAVSLTLISVLGRTTANWGIFAVAVVTFMVIPIAVYAEQQHLRAACEAALVLSVATLNLGE